MERVGGKRGSLGIPASSATESDTRKIVRHPMARRAAGTKGQMNNLSEYDIVTHCMALTRVKYQCFTILLLKINAKLGELNSMLVIEQTPSIPVVSKVPTIILGMDALFGSPEQSDIPSIAAMVGFMKWPLISSYRASGHTRSLKLEMIDSLFKLVSDKVDEGIVRKAFLDFYTSLGKRKPDQIIIFRDGVSKSQFNQGFSDNVWPGTIIDNKVCHPRNNDFYLWAHTGMIGTARPTHYHVLLGQIGFSADDLQELVYAMSKKRHRHICCGPYSLSSFGNFTVRAVYRV
ncbi:hypothetical protein GOBAR_AA30079 [Gossypium barbadense]|uniref:Piwi domain-containing protein n=1 Tax=Gossypium barbadense TaxID=3634 RepID=A0A2P5WHN6_GOSBA|nr:hypothetical protein GOBAR_AA30079 [Gossypium barbadense]